MARKRRKKKLTPQEEIAKIFSKIDPKKFAETVKKCNRDRAFNKKVDKMFRGMHDIPPNAWKQVFNTKRLQTA